MYTLLLIILSSISLYAQDFDTCDCTSPTSVGFINLDSPNDCSSSKQNVASMQIDYQLFRHPKPTYSSNGFVCMKWKFVKKIVGYFFRSYDTTFEKTEVPISRSECWDLSQNHMCTNPVTGASNALMQNGDNWIYNKQPEGDPYYMQEVSYTEFNCIIQPISIRQSCPTCPIESSIGRLSVDPKAQHTTHGLTTIVWNPIQFDVTPEACTLIPFKSGVGLLTMANTDTEEILLKDDANQLEYRINTSHIDCPFNRSMHRMHPVIGVSDLYIPLTSDQQQFIRNRHRNYEKTDTRLRFFRQSLQPTESFFTVGDEPREILFDSSLPVSSFKTAHHDRKLVETAKDNFLDFVSHKTITTAYNDTIAGYQIVEQTIKHNGTLCSFFDPDMCLTWLWTQGRFTLIPPLLSYRIVQTFQHFKRFSRISIGGSCLQKERKTNILTAGSCTIAHGVVSLEYLQDTYQLRIDDVTMTPKLCITGDPKTVLFMPCNDDNPNQKWLWGTDYLTKRDLPPEHSSYAELNEELMDEFRKAKISLAEYERNETLRIHEANNLLFKSEREKLFQEIDARNTSFQHHLQATLLKFEKAANEKAEIEFLKWAEQFKHNLTIEYEIRLKELNLERQRKNDIAIENIHNQYRNESEMLKKSHSSQLQLHADREEICRNHLTECDLKLQQDEPINPNRRESDHFIDRLTESLYLNHHYYMEDKAIERENILAKEIRQVYCHVKRLRKYQAILLAQSNGLAAAKALNIKDKCSRVQVHGENLLLQQCQHKTTTFSALKTNCGFEPFANGSTIAKDGYTLITFQPCYWQGSIVNFNGHSYKYSNDTWTLIQPNVNIDSLHLIDQFKALPDKELEYLIQMHAAQHSPPIEQINIFGDLTAQMTLTNSDTLVPLLKTTDHSEMLNWTFGWLRYLKIAFCVLISLLIVIPSITCCVRCCIICHNRRIQVNRVEIIKETVPLTTPIAHQSVVTHNATGHQHRHLRYDKINGYVWSDGCPLSS